MKRNTNEWLDRKVADWVSKGWISEESQQKIRKSYGRDEQRNPLLTTLLYMPCWPSSAWPLPVSP